MTRSVRRREDAPVGERKKSRDQDFMLVVEFDVRVGIAVGLPCCKSWRMRDCWRVSLVPVGGVMIS